MESRAASAPRLEPPRPGILARMSAYLSEMYPVPERLFSSILLYAGVAGFLKRICAVKAALSLRYSLIGIWSVFALMLILRLMDELKDEDVDRRLFPGRPLPSGRVLASDISLCLALTMGGFLAANLWAGKAFWMAAFVLGYAWLMFRFFFIPDLLRRRLLLNLATHNPICAILFLYVVVLFSAEHGLPLSRLDWPPILLLCLMYWAMFFAWEIARKIRCAQDENEYVTYSRIFGRAGAALAAAGAQSVSFGIGLRFWRELGFSRLFLATLSAGYGVALAGHARFLLQPNSKTSKLKPFAEGYIIMALLAFCLQFMGRS